MKLPILASLCLAVAASIFLARLAKGSLRSRAKIMATGLGPLAQTKHSVLGANWPVTFLTLNGARTVSPGWGPDFTVSAAITVPTSTATARKPPTAMRCFIVASTSLWVKKAGTSEPTQSYWCTIPRRQGKGVDSVFLKSTRGCRRAGFGVLLRLLHRQAFVYHVALTKEQSGQITREGKHGCQ